MSNDTCRWPGCDRTKILARGLCDRCYRRARAKGNLAEFPVTTRTCDVCCEDFTAGKHGRRFCSDACREVDYRATLAERVARRREMKAGRMCEQCTRPIPPGTRREARYCSVTCQQAAWYDENDEKLRRRTLEWQAARPAKVAEYAKRRNDQIAATRTEALTRAEIIAVSDGVCGICGERIDKNLPYPDPMCASVDHIVPLAKGGTHTRENLHVTHLRCNFRKGLKALSKVVMSE